MLAAARRLATGNVLLALGGAAGVTSSFVLGGAQAPHTAPPHPPITAPADAAPTDVEFIVSEAQRVQKADVEAWRRYRFSRRVEREDLDPTQRVVERRDLLFAVTPSREGFQEDLIRIDGREPGPDEKKREGRAGTFSKHYGTMVSGGGSGGEEGGYSLGLLLHLSSYRLAGRETRDGVACYRLDFSPAGGGRGGLAAKIADAMAGSLWITVEGFHLAGARAATVRPIPIGLFLSRVYDVQVTLDAQSVGEGVWLPRRIELTTHARFLIKPIRRRHIYGYSDFQRLEPAR